MITESISLHVWCSPSTPFSLPNTLHFALHNVTETVYFAKQVKFSWLVFLALFIYLLNPVEFVNNDIAVQSTSLS